MCGPRGVNEVNGWRTETSVLDNTGLRLEAGNDGGTSAAQVLPYEPHVKSVGRGRAQNSGTVFVPHGGLHAIMYSVVDSAKKARSSLAHFKVLNQDDGLLGNVNKLTAKSHGTYSPSISTMASYCATGLENATLQRIRSGVQLRMRRPLNQSPGRPL